MKGWFTFKKSVSVMQYEQEKLFDHLGNVEKQFEEREHAFMRKISEN